MSSAPPSEPPDISDRQGEAGRTSIREALSPEPADADSLIRATGLQPSVFHALILELEIGGTVERHAGNRYALRAD